MSNPYEQFDKLVNQHRQNHNMGSAGTAFNNPQERFDQLVRSKRGIAGGTVSGFDDLVRRAQQRNDPNAVVNDGYVNALLSDFSDFYNGYMNNRDSYGDRYGYTTGNLAQRGQRAREWLSASQEEINPEYYAWATGMLDNLDMYIGQMGVEKGFRDYVDWYNSSADRLNNFGWEEGYNASGMLDEDMLRFNEQANASREWLTANRKSIGEDYYKYAIQNLDNMMAENENLAGAYSRAQDHYRRWNTQEAYDRDQRLLGMDIAEEEAWLQNIEKDYEDMQVLAGEYGMLNNPDVPEDIQAQNRARYEEIVNRYGVTSAEELWEQMDGIHQRRIDLRDAREIQAEAQLQEQIPKWQEKYAGKTYTQLSGVLEAMEDGEEKQWLSQYADSIMTSRDMSVEIGKLNNRIAKADRVLAGYRDRMKDHDTGGSSKDDAEIRARANEYLQRNGYQNIKALEAEWEALNNRKWELDKRQKYGDIESRGDFDSNSQVQDGPQGILYAYINDLPTAQPLSGGKQIGTRESITRNAAEAGGSNPYERYDYMTDDERSIYNYIHNTQGAGAAQEYLDYLSYTLNARRTKATRGAFQNMNFREGAAASAISVPANLLSGMGTIDVAFQNLKRDIIYKKTGEYTGPIDYNSDAMMATHLSGGIRESVSKSLADRFGVIDIDPDKAPMFAKILNGKSWGDVYQLGMSMLDSLAIRKLVPIIGRSGTVLLGGAAASQGMLHALEQGATDEQALKMGLFSGLWETLFESWSLDKILSLDTTSILKAFAKQGFIEATEEANTGIANYLTDVIVMGRSSEFQNKVRQYTQMGYTEEEAKKQAFWDAVIQVGWDFAGGFISGGLMGGGQTLQQNMQYRRLPANIRNQADRFQEEGIGRNEAVFMASALDLLAEEYGDQAEVFRSNFRTSQDVAEYQREFHKAYKMGVNNANRETLNQEGAFRNLTEAQRTAAYEAGVAAREAKNAKAVENKAAEKTDQEGGYAVSEDGKTIRTDTGETVEIKGFRRIGANPVLDTKSGNTVNAADVSYASAGEAALYEIIGKSFQSVEGANKALEEYRNSGMTAEDFAAGVEQAFNEGQLGHIPLRQVMAMDLASQIPEAVIKAAYNAGEAQGRRSERRSQMEITRRNQRRGNPAREGKLHFDRKGRTFDEARETSLSAMETLAKALGIDIYVFESYEKDGKRVYIDDSGQEVAAPNGFYDPSNSSIHIDLNAGNLGKGTMLFTVAHELTHFIRQWSKVKYRTMADILIRQYGEQGTSVEELIAGQIAKAANNGREMGRGEAFEEVVADSMEAMLVKGDMAKFLEYVQRRDKNLGTKIRYWLRNLADKLRAAVKAYGDVNPETAEGRLVAQMGDFIQVLQASYTQALVDASENYRAAEGQKNTTLEGGVKYSINQGFYTAFDAWDGKKTNVTFTVGNTSGPLKLIGMKDHEIKMHSGMVISKLNKHKELSRDIFRQIPDLLESPIIVQFSDAINPDTGKQKYDNSITVIGELFANTTVNGKTKSTPVLVALNIVPTKKNSSVVLDFSVVKSAYTKDALQNYLNENSILYVDPDKKRTDSWLSRTGLSLPVGENRYGPIRRITYDGGKVKVQNPKNMTDMQKALLKAGAIDEFGNKLFSDRNNATYAEIEEERRALYQRENELNQRKREAENNPELLKAMSDYHDLFTEMKELLPKRRSGTATQEELARIEEIKALREEYLQKVADLQERLGLNAMSQEADEIRETKEALRIASDEAWAREGAERENKAIEKAGLTASEYFRKKALRAFKTTTNFNEAGYMLPDGKMLNFSGGERNHRYRDHREIGEIYEATNGTAALNRFLSDGNIRIMAESPGIDIASGVEPTAKQYAEIKRFVNANGIKDRKFFVDFSHADGRRAGNYSYEGAVNADRVVNDIKYYYENGKVREQSSIAQFRWSDRDPIAAAMAQELERQNEQLIADVENLKKLLAMQGKVTGGKVFKPSSVANAADYLAKTAGATLNSEQKKELAGMLDEFYTYIASGDELVWEDVREKAEPIARFLETNAKDSKSVERAYNYDLLHADLVRAVYDSFWRVENLRTVADKNLKEVNELKAKHRQQMEKLRTQKNEAIDRLRKEQADQVKKVREESRQKIRDKVKATERRYQESRKNATEKRHVTATKNKLRKLIQEISALYTRGTKERNVKKGMRNFVEQALAAADVLWMENYSDEDLVRNGVRVQMSAEERKLLEQTQELLRQRDDVFKGGKAEQEIANIEAGETEGLEALSEQYEKLDEKIRKNMRRLQRALKLQRAMLNETTITSVLEGLAEAYKELGSADEMFIRSNIYEATYKGLKDLIESVRGTTVTDMTNEQLLDVEKAFREVLHTIRQANKSFTNERAGTIAEQGGRAAAEVRQVGGQNGSRLTFLDPVRKFLWNNFKPVYAMETIGSQTLMEAFKQIRNGEDVWARDIRQARQFFREVADKYGYDGWDPRQVAEFTTPSGKTFQLTLGQMMSIYAYSKRENAQEHLRLGGIVFDPYQAAYRDDVDKKNALKLKRSMNDATAYQISTETVKQIMQTMTQEQIGFVDEMQKYLSETMGAKGNEVSMKLFGVELFGEENYFPMKSARQFLFEQNQPAGEVKLVNSGFTKAIQPGANNPIVLGDFVDVWSKHVNDMSSYHGFALPIEDFNRIYNYQTGKSEGKEPVSVKSVIQSAYTPAATQYISQMITDVNGGARIDPAAGIMSRMLSLFKKGAVFASASVVIQQPSSIGRALALIDGKYFSGQRLDPKKHDQTWEEVKEYAPVAIIKEMGFFDTSVGKATQDYITGKEYHGFREKFTAFFSDSRYRDEKFSRAPALADELTWCAIWEAVKREQAELNPNANVNSKAFLEQCGERFTEIITKTQVYDSVLSRSANMRSKDTGMQMATAFMAEPTTSINMLADALIKGRRGNKQFARKAIGAVIAAQILNAVLVSLVYAMRDDDEDKNYEEKYLKHLSENLVSDVFFLVPNTLPFVRDIMSLCQGYEVERSDMSVISDILKAFKAVGNKNMTPWQKAEKVSGSVAQLFGLPVKNILRDTRGLVNTVRGFFDRETATGAGLWNAILEGATGKSVSEGEQLYRARVKGDDAHETRLEARYSTEESADAAVRNVIREKFMDGEIDELEAARQLVLYGNQNGNEAYWLIDGWKYARDKGTSDGYRIYGRLYDAMLAGNSIDDTLEEFTEYGYDEEDVLSNLKKEIGKWYYDDESDTRVTREEVERMLESYFDMDGAEIEEQMLKWDMRIETGFSYQDLKEQFFSGAVTEEQAMQYLQKYGQLHEADAKERMADWKFEQEHGYSYDDIRITYQDGEITAAEARQVMMEFAGKTREEADKSLKIWDFELKEGWAYEDRAKLYKRGEISESQLTDALVEIGEYSREDARTQAEVYRWEMDGLSNVSISRVEKWHEYCEGNGISREMFLEIAKFSANTNNDVDENGKTVYYSAMKKVMAQIDKLPLSKEQKTALAKAMGWSNKNINKYKPW